MLAFGVRAPLLAVALLAAAPAALPPAGPPPGPPNGTYTYALSRNGGAQGTTTVTVYRRDDLHEIETSESGAAAAARLLSVAAYRYGDFGVDSYAGTYQAPFLRSSPLGRTDRFGAAAPFAGQWTVRFRSVPGALVASIDGTPFVDRFEIPAQAKRFIRAPWVLDGPFMTGALLLPAFRRRSGDAALAPVSEAFPSGVPLGGERLVRATPAFPKTPKTDLALDVPGLLRVWFDPATYVVHEVHFTAVNFDAHLVSYVRGNAAAPFAPQPVAAAAIPLPRETAAFTSADGTSLSALVSRPPAAKAASSALVFVPPGPASGADFDGDGPTPMYPSLARAFVDRGYTVVRYDMRGVGKSGGSSTAETWDEALADAKAAVALATTDAGIDPKRVYLLGYGNGADLALAAASTERVAGVVALGPTVLAYRSCAAALAGGPASPADPIWRRSALAHDVAALAQRGKAPLLVLHPGLPVCGETKDQVDAYDDGLRQANTRATIVAANDLTQYFGGRYEAEAPIDTQAFFPYVFDTSTAAAIADWLDNPKAASAPQTGGTPGVGHSKPPPPPGVDTESGAGLPAVRHGASASPAPVRSVEPGVVLPSGATLPPDLAPPTTPGVTPAPAVTVSSSPAASGAPQAAPPGLPPGPRPTDR